jgi:hypothetical protein
MIVCGFEETLVTRYKALQNVYKLMPSPLLSLSLSLSALNLSPLVYSTDESYKLMLWCIILKNDDCYGTKFINK